MPHALSPLLTRILALAMVLGLGLPALGLTGPAAAAASGLALSGTVTGPGGTPLAGVEVTVIDVENDEEAVVATATTNAAGEYGVAELAGGGYEVLATPAADDPALLASATKRVSVGNRDEVVDLALAVSTLRGVVHRSDGSPAAGATVAVQEYSHHRAITYPDGTFRLALDHGEWTLGARPPAENPALDVSVTRTVTVVGGAVADVDITLGRPNLRGTVLAPDGTTGVAGARVRLYDRWHSEVPAAVMVSRSDGSFGFTVPSGEYRFDVQPPAVNPDGWVGYRSNVFEVAGDDTAEAPAVQDLVLRGPTLTGVVRAPDGDPVPRAWVHVWSDGTGEYNRTRSDAAGHYGLSVPAGTARVRLSAAVPTAAYLDREYEIEIPDLPHALDLTFLRPTVTGRVLTSAGTPVVGASVSAYGPNPDGVGQQRYATTDREGRYALHVAPGTTQRLVAEPEESTPDGIRTARVVEVPATGTLDGTDITLEAAPLPPYELRTLKVQVEGLPASRATSPSISYDGSVVAVLAQSGWCDCAGRESGLPTAESTDPPAFDGVAFFDRATEEFEPLLAPGGGPLEVTGPVALDDDGSTVAFLSGQDGLVAGDDDGIEDVFVLDRPTGTITRIARPADAYFDSSSLQLSGDGTRLLARFGWSVAGDFLHDLAVVDLGATGAETSRRLLEIGTRQSPEGALSRDGDTVAWTQYHRSAPGEGEWHIHVLDLVSGEEDPTRHVSEGEDDWNGYPGTPQLSDDGSVLVYGDVTKHEEAGEYPVWARQLRIADRAAGTDRAVDPFGHDTDPRAADVADFELSGPGTELLVESRGGLPEESDGQAWLVDLADDSAQLVSRTASGAPALDGVSMLAAPSDFSVLALGSSSEDLTGASGEQVVLALAEEVPPVWPAGAALTAAAGDIGTTSVRLQWTEATDNVRVTGYRVLRGDTVVGTTNGTTRQLRVTGLAPDTAYTFRVQAVDGRGSATTDGPSVSVRTLPSDSTELRPLDLTPRPGGGVDLAWEAATGADALVLRTYLGETQVDERELAGDATSAQERGLAAATAYSFQVFHRAGGTLRPYTARGTVTTPALTFGSLTWTVPTVRADVARRGSTATITAVAEPGRQLTVAVEHRSWYDEGHELLETPRSVTSVVPLTEAAGTPGTYTGGFELVDGVARVVGMVGTVADGRGGTLDRASTRGPVAVSSDVVVTVDAPEGSLLGGRIQLASDATRQTWSDHLSGGDVVTLDHLRPATDLAVQVVDGRGRTAAERTGLRVREGLATAITLDPVLPATLEVTASPGSRVQLTDAETGEFLESRWLYGSATEFRDVQEGQRVRVDVAYEPGDLLQPEDPRTLTLDAGENHLAVVARPVPRAALSGVVRYDDGRPAPGARMTLAQDHLGERVQLTATAGEDGVYSFDALRRPGTLTVTSGQLRDTVEVDLTDGPVVRDVELSGPRTYTVSLRLFARPAGAGAETGPIPLDWRTAVHFGMGMQLDGRSLPQPGAPRGPEESAALSVQAIPGQQLTWCVDGREAKVQRTCVTHTLTAGDRTPTVELHAGPGVDVTMDVVDEAGRPVTSSHTALYQVTPTGRAYVTGGRRTTSTVTERVPAAGTYVLEVYDDERSASRTFTVVPADDEVDLGEVVLSRRVNFSGSGNAVVPNRSDVLPGGDVEMRATWHHRGPGSLAGVTARIAVPSDTTLVADSVLLDGRPVAVAAGDGHVDVDLGTVPVGGTGTLRYRLRAGADATGLPGRVDLRFPVPGGTSTESLEPVTVPVVAVTVSGPATVAAPRIPLKGRAPAGRTVTISDGGVPVGSAVAGPGGYWSATVRLAEQARSRVQHQLVAETTVDGERFFAEHAVTVDDTWPSIQSVSMYQLDGQFPNGRRVTFDPAEGVARFPFVWVPGQELRVEVTFDEPSRVSYADVIIGSTRVAAVRRGDGVFVASTYAQVSGPVSVDYDGIAKPASLDGEEQSEREVRDGVPAELAGFELTDVQTPDPSGSGPRVGSFRMSVPSVPGGSLRSTLTVTRETYTPTAEDLALERETGVPLYGVRATRSGSTLSFSMLVPVADVPGLAARAESDGTQVGGALADMLRDAVGPAVGPAVVAPRAGGAVGVARVGFEVAFNATTTLDSLLSAIGAGDKYDKLGKTLDLVNGCSPGKIAAYDKRAQDIAMAAAAADIGGALFSIGSLVLGPATFGLGTVALGVLGWALDKVIGKQLDNAIDALALDIETDPDCRDKEKWVRPDPPRVADPVWIYDPSGFVYEGARSVRIPGVTATLLTAPSADGPWTAWDAEWFGQENPQTTDDAGRYGWDVPEGWWKVAYTKDGYRPTYSRVLRVLPPHLDVDVSMVKDGFPHVTASAVRDGGVDVTFDRLVRSGTTDRGLTVVDPAGDEVPGTWSATGATTGDGDLALQRGLRFTPTATVAPGTVLTVSVDGVVDYGGRLMADAYTASLTVPRAGGGGPGGPTAKVPAAPAGVTATAGERFADVTWTAPDDGGSALLDYVVTVLPSGRQLTVGADETSVRFADLAAGTAYRFTVAARNAVGTGPVSAPSDEVVPTAHAPESTLTSAPSGFVVSRSAEVAWESTGTAYVCELDGADRPCAGTGLALDRLGSGTHVLSVAAVDEDGDVDPTPAVARWTVPRDDRALRGGRPWQRKTSPGAFQGTYTQARDRGATLTATVTGATRLALVVARGRGQGTVTVYLGQDRLGRIDLASGTSRQRQLVALPAFDRPRSGTVRIVVTSRREVVRVDGLAVATG